MLIICVLYVKQVCHKFWDFMASTVLSSQNRNGGVIGGIFR